MQSSENYEEHSEHQCHWLTWCLCYMLNIAVE